jgi:ABC-type phosphate transport system permease subunit
MNLWKPHEVAQQIWRASNPEIKLTEGTEWKKVPSSNIITIWWVLGLVSIFAAIVIDVVFDPEQTQDPLSMSLYQNIVTIPAVVVSIISIFYFMRMIRQISVWQDRKST